MKPPCLAPWKQNVLKHFVLLDFIFMVYLPLYYGNQVADCWFHPLEGNSAPCSWLEAELSLQAGRGGDVGQPGACGSSGSLDTAWELWGWLLLPPECTFSICSVKTAAICPRTCVVCWKVLPVPTGVCCQRRCKMHILLVHSGVPRAGRPCRGHSQLWPGLSSVLV